MKFSESGMSMKAGYSTEFIKPEHRISREFYTRDVLDVAPYLTGVKMLLNSAVLVRG